MNVFTFTGNLGGDCEVKTVGSSTVCNFSVAATSGYGDNKKTHWVNCAIWGKQAESGLPAYLKKGQQVAISGELSLREYQAGDGTQKTSLDLRVNSVSLVGAKSEQTLQQQPVYQQQPQQQQPYAAPQQQQYAPQQQAVSPQGQVYNQGFAQPQQQQQDAAPPTHNDLNSEIPF